MNIIEDKTFLLKLEDFKEIFKAIYKKHENENYFLISYDNKKIFKICLNKKNESEYYEKSFILTQRLKCEIIKTINNLNIEYIEDKFDYNQFFIQINPLKIPISELQYTLTTEEPNDYLTKNNWIGKTIYIESDFLEQEVTVFIYRESNYLIYCVIEKYNKIVKYVFKIINDYIYLVKEERYNAYKTLNFLKFKEDFSRLITTSHEMQEDISEDKETIMIYKNKFSLIE